MAKKDNLTPKDAKDSHALVVADVMAEEPSRQLRHVSQRDDDRDESERDVDRPASFTARRRRRRPRRRHGACEDMVTVDDQQQKYRTFGKRLKR